jgi:hypothetical protein
MGRLITIKQVSDSVEAEMLKDLLSKEGIIAHIPGNTHGAMLGGIGAAVLRVPLQVDVADEKRARAVLDALVDYDEIDPSDAQGPDEDGPRRGDGPYRGSAMEDELPQRKPHIAIAAALVLPVFTAVVYGGGHFYARERTRGFILLVSAWCLFALGLSGMVPYAFAGLPIIVLLDAVGAYFAITAQNRRAS